MAGVCESHVADAERHIDRSDDRTVASDRADDCLIESMPDAPSAGLLGACVSPVFSSART